MARSGPTPNDPTKTPLLKEIRERYEYARTQWSDIRKEAAIDMQFVKGNPWDDEDEEIRKDRPTIAPEEMSQYRNQVTNALRGNPRGMKFQPAGGGASAKSAQFYQEKAREIEYRSHAVEAYIGGAENVLQRSYGYWRIKTDYENPRSPNQELWIEGFPDPDVVLPDPDAKRRTSEDMQYCYVLEVMPRAEFKRKYKKAKVVNFGDYVDRYKDWVIGAKSVQVAEYWSIETTARDLFAVMLAMQPPGQPPQLAQKPMFAFDDEIEAIRKQASRGVQIVSARSVRKVDYPKVKLRITNGLEILHEEDWKGKYIPIVSVYGPILYVPEGGQVKKTILSMTRHGRFPWKAYCYASSQELEVLGMVPHGSVVAAEGQLAGYEDDWEDALHNPKLVLYYKNRVPGMPAEAANLEKPTRLEYTQGEYLQAISVVKEGYRRAIQAAMGSNFLPTQAQKRNEKSGVALGKMEDAATQGTYHFVDAYEDGIRHTGVIIEDLLDKIHDYQGETAIMNAKLESKSVPINNPEDEEAFPTRGDHLVTVSTAPSSDSEFDAVQTFLESVISNLGEIAKLRGPDVAAALLAQTIRGRNMGQMGDAVADLIEPPEFKAQDGKPPDPALLQAKAQIQQLQQQLQKMGFEIQTKQVEGRTKFMIEKYKTDATSHDKAADREVKLAVAELGAKMDRFWLLLEESRLVGARADAAAERRVSNAHDSVENAKDRAHDVHMVDRSAAHSAAAASQGAAIDASAADQSAAHDAASAEQDGQIAGAQIEQQAELAAENQPADAGGE